MRDLMVVAPQLEVLQFYATPMHGMGLLPQSLAGLGLGLAGAGPGPSARGQLLFSSLAGGAGPSASTSSGLGTAQSPTAAMAQALAAAAGVGCLEPPLPLLRQLVLDVSQFMKSRFRCLAMLQGLESLSLNGGALTGTGPVRQGAPGHPTHHAPSACWPQRGTEGHYKPGSWQCGHANRVRGQAAAARQAPGAPLPAHSPRNDARQLCGGVQGWLLRRLQRPDAPDGTAHHARPGGAAAPGGRHKPRAACQLPVHHRLPEGELSGAGSAGQGLALHAGLQVPLSGLHHSIGPLHPSCERALRLAAMQSGRWGACVPRPQQ